MLTTTPLQISKICKTMSSKDKEGLLPKLNQLTDNLDVDTIIPFESVLNERL